MKTIIVTGTPGTGKTTLSRKLAEKLDFQYVDVSKVIKKYNISEGYDKKRKSKIIDTNKLNNALIKEIDIFKKTTANLKNNTIKKNNKNNEKINIKNLIINKIIKNKKTKKGMIIDSHLSHFLPRNYVDLCIITKCNLKVLEKRLKKRKYSIKKIRENLDAEIFDICLNEAKENKHEVFVADTSKGIKMAVDSLLQGKRKLK